MDPASIIGLISSSVGLATQTGKIAKDIQTLSSQYKYAEVSLVALSNECRTFATVLNKTEAWLRSVDDGVTHDQLILEQLSSSLECGNVVLKAFEDDLFAFTEPELHKSPWRKTKFLFNEGVFDGHQKRIDHQLQALSCLLQSMNLPTPAVQRKHIDDNETNFRAAESSAWTIIDSGGSICTWQTDRTTTDDGLDLVYKPLSFGNALFTSRVYKRNFRPKEKAFVSKTARATDLKDQLNNLCRPPPPGWQRGDLLTAGILVDADRSDLEKLLKELTNDLWYPPPISIMTDERRVYVHELVLHLLRHEIRPQNNFLQSLCNQSKNHILNVLQSIFERDDTDLQDLENNTTSEDYSRLAEEAEKRKQVRLQWLAQWKLRTAGNNPTYPNLLRKGFGFLPMGF